MELKQTFGSKLMLIVAFVALLGVPLLFAEKHDHDHEHEQHSAHEHGKANLNLVLEGKELHIEIQSPSVNLVGFEHEPNTDEQKATVQKAIETLRDVPKIFVLPSAAECQLKNIEIESFVNEHEEGHDKEEHHDDHGKEEHHDDHGKEEHHEDEGEIHSEFHLEYQFSCGVPEDLTSMEIGLFEPFPGFEEIDAQIITPSKQTSQELTKDQSVLKL